MAKKREGKKHPDVINPVGFQPKKSLSETQQMISGIVREVESDEDSRQEWLHRQALYYRRRYVREDRQVNWPWSGAADIVMPLIDMKIDAMKSTLSRVIFSRPFAKFIPMNSESIPRAPSATKGFQYLLDHRMPDFREQMLIMLDTLLQYGFCVLKVFWDYRTVSRPFVLTKNRIPSEFAELVGMASGAAGGAFAGLANVSGVSGPQIEAIAESLSAQDRKRIFQQNRETIKGAIAKKWGLDGKEKEDKEAINKIFEFLQNPTKEKTEFRAKEVLANNPRVVALDPNDFIVPRSCKDIQDCTRLTHRLFLSPAQLKSRVNDNGWSKDAVDFILERTMTKKDERARFLRRTTIEQDKDFREGLNVLTNTDTDDLIEVWEHYRLMDINGDNRDEMTSMVIHPATNTLLRDIRELPFEHSQWPFIQAKFEVNDPRYYSSRGVPEKLDDIDIEITRRHRNKLNAMDLMVPSFLYRHGLDFVDNFQFVPGGMYPALDPANDLVPINVPDRTINDEREENILLTWSERYLGSLDTSLAAQNNLSEARTATEIQAIQQNMALTLGFRGEVLQASMKKIYNMVWDLWNQWGDNDLWMKVTGQEMRRLTKEDIKGDFDIVPVGTVQTADPALEAQRAFTRLGAVVQLVSTLGPDFLGARFELNISELFLDWMRKDNIAVADLVVRERSPEEQQAFLQRQQAKQAAIDALETNQEMTIPQAQAALKEIGNKAPFKDQQRVTANVG